MTRSRFTFNAVAPTIAAITLVTAIVVATGALHLRREAPPSQHRVAAPTAGVRAAIAVQGIRSARATDVQTIELAGGELRIDVRSLPRANAAVRLAGLTDSRIVDRAGLLALAPPLDLRWRGRDPVVAWQRVLGSELRHSASCAGTRCTIRILSIEDVEGGTVLVPEPVNAEATTGESPPGLMNRPTDPDAIDESALGG